MHVDETHFDLLVHKESHLVIEGSIEDMETDDRQEADVAQNKSQIHENDCKHCSKKFQTEQGLKVHTAKTHRDKMLSCEHCKHKFTGQDDLKYHMENMHTMIGPGYMGWKANDEYEKDSDVMELKKNTC